HHPDGAGHRPPTGPVRLRGPPRLLRGRRPRGHRGPGGPDPRRRPPARRGGRDRRPVAGDAPHRQPPPPPGARFRRDPGRRRRHRPGGPGGPPAVRGRRAGLDKVDRGILTALCRPFGGAPVGLSTLAVSVGEEPETVEDVYEPYLLKEGFLQRTPRGRVATAAAFAHLGVAAPAERAGPGTASMFDG